MSEESEIIGIISSRKYALYERIKTELEHKQGLQDYDTNELRSKLREAISTLPNMMFLSKEEKDTKKIIPDLRLEKIGIDQEVVYKRILEYLSR